MSKTVFILSNPYIDIPHIAEYVVAEQGLSTLSFWNGDKAIMSGEINVLPQYFLSYFFAYSDSLEGAEKLRLEFVQRKIDEAENEVRQAKFKVDRWVNVMNKLNAEAKPFSKKFGVDFHSAGGALTLRPSDIGEHPSGWVVSGKVKEDYFLWVNEFDAVHPALGRVWGDFESEVFFTSIEAYEDFRKYFSPEDWDYWDI